jgi:hypothetical protein
MNVRSNYVRQLGLKKSRVGMSTDAHRQLACGILSLEMAVA